MLEGTPALRTPGGWRRVAEGKIRAADRHPEGDRHASSFRLADEVPHHAGVEPPTVPSSMNV